MQPPHCGCFSQREHTDRGASYNDGVHQPVYTPHGEPVKSSICSSPGPSSTPPPPQYSRHLNHSQHRRHAARSSLSFSTTSRLASPSPPPLPPPPRRGHNEALRRNISSSFGSPSLRSAISTTGPWGNVAALSHTASVIR